MSVLRNGPANKKPVLILNLHKNVLPIFTSANRPIHWNDFLSRASLYGRSVIK
jgi:hypothetical protein